MNSDFKELLALFNAEAVEYLIIGGYAVIEYAEPRYTKDLDVWIRADDANAKRVFRALSRFGAPLTGMSAADFAEEGFVFQIGVAPVRVDVLMSIDGVTFPEAWENRVQVTFDDLPVWMISRQDLIRAKRAAGRPQDIQDADNLERNADS